MDLEDFTVVARRVEPLAVIGRSTGEALECFLADFVAGLMDEGCTIIGHIKGMLSGKEGKRLFFSVTTPDGGSGLRGGPLHSNEQLSLAINVIVAGVKEDNIDKLFESSLQRFFSRPGGG
jgi:hypothetical protein